MGTDHTHQADDLTLRAPTWDDADAVLALLNRYAMAVAGKADTSELELRNEWSSPTFSMETDVRLAAKPDGTLLGYVDYYNTRGEGARPFVYTAVDPDVERRPVVDALVQWAIARATEDIPKAPAGVRFTLLAGADAAAVDTLEAWREVGFSENRRFYHMHIDFDGPLPEPVLPEGYRIRCIRPDEHRTVYRAILSIFKDHYGFVQPKNEDEEFAQWKHHNVESDDYDPNLQFLAVDAHDELAGLSLCRPADGPDEDTAYVATLGVARDHRAKGIGEALLRHSFRVFRDLGRKGAALGVDAESLTNATRLYEKVGMHTSRVFVQMAKVLRDGRESANLG